VVFSLVSYTLPCTHKLTPNFGRHVDNAETPGKCYCHTLYGTPKVWGCYWFELWKSHVVLAHFRKQVVQVFYFPGQVGQGKIKWEDCAEQSIRRDSVMSNWPKDDVGWAKKMSAADEAAYVASLREEERHCCIGLGGSQKAEVAWLEKHGIPFDELDVGEASFSATNSTPQNPTLHRPGDAVDGAGVVEQTTNPMLAPVRSKGKGEGEGSPASALQIVSSSAAV
jgi:hypothetical protein